MRIFMNLVRRLLGSGSTGGSRTRSTGRGRRPARAGTSRGGASGGILGRVRRALR